MHKVDTLPESVQCMNILIISGEHIAIAILISL